MGTFEFCLNREKSDKGKVTKVKKGDIVGLVEVELLVPAAITSVITADSIEQLGLNVGDEVYAVIKATEVMISIS